MISHVGDALTPEEAEQCEKVYQQERSTQALEAAYRGGQLTANAAAALAVDLWTQKPDGHAPDIELWVSLFRRAGFTMDAQKAPEPRNPMLLFRGASRRARCGLSWTAELEQANYFAGSRHREGRIWCTYARADAMLAWYGWNDGRLGEKEVVLDPNSVQGIIELSAERVTALLQSCGTPFSGQYRRKRLRWSCNSAALRNECLLAAKSSTT